MYEHFYDILTERAARDADRPAFTIVGGTGASEATCTFRELDDAARRLARVLREATVPGERAVILATTSTEYVVAFFGCLHAGIVGVPAYPPHPRRADGRIDGIMRDAAPEVVLTTSKLVSKLRGSAAVAGWRDDMTWILIDEAAEREPTNASPIVAGDRGLAFLQYTSGSTRDPRGVRVTHGNLLHNTGEIARRLTADVGDVAVSWLPLFHDMGLVGGVLAAIRSGSHAYLIAPADFTARPALWLETLSRTGAVITLAPNFGYELATKRVSDDVLQSLDLSRLRVALSGAEQVRPETIDAFSTRFAAAGFKREAFLPAYGMAECTLMVSGGGAPTPICVELDGRSYVGCGAPIDGLQVRVVDGEVWVAGPSVADGYWNRDASADDPFGVQIPGDSGAYLRTGDLGAEIDGQIVITGRSKDLVILRGTNVHPQDVEWAVARCHAALAGGVAAVGAMIAGEERLVIVAEVDRKSVAHGVDGDAVLAEVRAAVAAEANAEIGALALVQPLTIPRTSSGKIRRAACKAAWLGRQLPLVWDWSIEAIGSADNAEQHDGDMVAILREEIARELRVPWPDALEIDRPLGDLGLDSIGLVGVRGAIEARLGRSMSIDTIGDNPTIRELAERLRGGVTRAETPQRVPVRHTRVDVDVSIMFFAAEAGDADGTQASYDFVLEACRTADRAELRSVWFPERHFHRFGGLFPNPSVLAAAVAAVTHRVRIRAGSVVLPLHDPLRVREEWAVVDQLSGGRVDLAFASGWDANSYALNPARYTNRKQAVLDGIDEFISLWRGAPARRRNGHGHEVELAPLPTPRQPLPGIWLTIAQDPEMFAEAGRRGLNVLTALLFQSLEELSRNIRVYRDARQAAGLNPDDGRVTLMLHAFVGEEESRVKELVRAPLKYYLNTSVDLWKQESRDLSSLSPRDRDAVVDLAFERYYRESGLFGSLERARATLRRMRDGGVDEIACLIDFGVEAPEVLRSIALLGSLTAAPSRAPSLANVRSRDSGPVDLSTRHRRQRTKTRDIFVDPMAYALFDQVRDAGLMSFYQEFGDRRGPFIQHGDRWLLQLGSLDYLGLSIDQRVREAAAQAARASGTSRTGSRLHNGSTPEQRAFERRLADFVGQEDALVFATGYQAQIGLVSGLADPDTTVVLDEHAHASLYDGAQIARCRIERFRHNDVRDLERTLSRLRQDAPALVITEGLYSNEGDLAPLRAIAATCAAHGVRLALDEAHALGVLGATGRGSGEELAPGRGADILAGTFSKSLASVGGWVAGPAKVIDWVRFHGRSILFSAAVSPASLAAAAAALDVLMAEPWRVTKLRQLGHRWRHALVERGLEVGDPRGPIVPVYLGDDLLCLRVSHALMQRGIYVNTVVPPSVPQGKALLRTCVTAAHDWEQLGPAADVIAEVIQAETNHSRRARRA